ncbi:MAG: radical SAM protein [Candidatus Nitricoxidivorans perseverans]|uniref:Radical SAM protein n=1 Tax=Candidatus Nitricoxidivorans perseverans TaxID=2975601 RepID=A0AA49FLL2_9PROT|nr:MAG: radical SAM protein [Candidatus Nitricoxidivorans perseverans]
MPDLLTVEDHRRDIAGMTYAYPVLSRRAGGISIGINLNPNNACNWRCIYCQVPDLTRGGPPPVDLPRLESELGRLLDDVVAGRFAEAAGRRPIDVAFSGNGEPTAAREFPEAVAIAQAALAARGLSGEVKLRLITNGSLIDRAAVRAGIARLGRAGGEVWFKLDAATPAATARINGVRPRIESVERRLAQCANLCETWVQTCVFALDGEAPREPELSALLSLLGRFRGVVAGVHLYGLARPSRQPEAERLQRLTPQWLEAFSARIRETGLTVKVSP